MPIDDPDPSSLAHQLRAELRLATVMANPETLGLFYEVAWDWMSMIMHELQHPRRTSAGGSN